MEAEGSRPLLWPPPRMVRQEGAALAPRPDRWPLPRGLTTALRARIEELFPGPTAGSGFTFAFRPAELPSEGYRLVLDRDVRLEAADEAGARHGLATLVQVARQCPRRWPGLTVEDWPDFRRRGVMLDISRCKVPTLATLKSLVELLAGLKYNELQLYMEHTFAFPGHEAVWGDASPLTAEEVRELDVFAAARGVELVPNFNSFGHFERWLRHPAYRHLAECPEGFTTPWGERRVEGSTLKPDLTSLKFLDKLHDALLPCFRSRRFNIGGDEPWELGQGWSKPLCEQHGKHRVYVDFINALHDRVARRGHRVLLWADIVLEDPSFVKDLPRELTGMIWGYEADHPFAEQAAAFAKAGLPFQVCPGTSAWNSLGGRTANAVGNLTAAAVAGRASKAEGYLVTDWGDGGHHQVLPVSLPGYVCGAAQAWCGEAAGEGDLGGAIDLALGAWGGGERRAALVGVGKAVVDLGRVADVVSKRPRNSSVFHHFLFSGGEWAPGEVPAREVKSARRRLSAWRESTAALAPSRWKEELLLAGDLAALGLRRRLRETGEKDGGEKAYYADFRAAIGRYEDAWLARNRPGGLWESSGRLRAALKP